MSKTLDNHSSLMKYGMRALLFPSYARFRSRFVESAGILRDDLVLDFGCGVGLLEEFLLPRISGEGKVTGVDIGKNLIEQARSHFAGRNNVEFVLLGNDSRLPFPDNSFSVIVSNLVMHLLDRSQKEAIFGEFYRVLRPGGRMALAEIGRPYNLSGLFARYIFDSIYGRIWSYERNSADSFKGLLPVFIAKAGFDNVRIVDRMKGYIDFITCDKKARKG